MYVFCVLFVSFLLFFLPVQRKNKVWYFIGLRRARAIPGHVNGSFASAGGGGDGGGKRIRNDKLLIALNDIGCESVCHLLFGMMYEENLSIMMSQHFLLFA